MTKEIYEKIHKALDFDTAQKNIADLFDVRREMGAKNPRVELYFSPA
jgi:hypothetical protein